MFNQKKASTVIATATALLAFAGNSVLCRLALAEREIDAGSFTVLRIIAGAVVLMLLWRVRECRAMDSKSGFRSNWLASTLLFTYALSFSYAYLSLDTGSGALILFGVVQLVLVLDSWRSGKRLAFTEICGVLVCFTGLVYLVLPSLSTPSAQGAALMVIAGLAWAGYTLVGYGSQLPLRDTAINFVLASPLIMLWMLIDYGDRYYSLTGVVYALLSGALASGIGYAIWYHAIKGLKTSTIGAVQLLVPIIASLGGVLFSNETLSVRLVVATGFVLGGLLIVVLQSHQGDVDSVKSKSS
ncbi:EamA family transporter [Vibrio albus]|uniref:EamA family transporter n=1 Tax=Vibrio albus TaxID=2200953 RepID=A0A2U3B798_9VIBR|nr:DMT family transporter [Vibrio albus]PWI32683.1 EamA family transporter [Vibrio albus]